MKSFFLLLSLLLSASCSAQSSNAPNKSPVGIANPASVNCNKVGGSLSMLKRGDGGTYGICIFEDNRQCEEWALLRRECPIGGAKITGYTSPAQIYCVIQGGKTIAEPGAQCTLPTGKVCDNDALYQGQCSPK